MPPLLVSSIEIRRLPLSALMQAMGEQESLSHDEDECGAVPVSISLRSVELTELLDRVADIARIRWRLDGSRISLRCDQPFSRSYAIDYPAIERNSAFTGTAGLPGQSGLFNGSAHGAGGGAGGSGQQQTSSRHQNRFWDNLVSSIEQWLAAGEELTEPVRITETEINRSDQGQFAAQPNARQGAGNTRGNVAASPASGTLDSAISRTVTNRTEQRRSQVSAHAESGLIHVRATARQHRHLARLLAQTQLRVRQQIEIQALLLEVRLSRHYERGIQWSRDHHALGNLSLTPPAPVVGATPGLIFNRASASSDGASLAIRFLEQFGAVQVVSSPRVLTLHQQPALLRMVENRVYFTISAQSIPAGPNSGAFSVFNTQANSIPVGFVMSVLPSVDESQSVTLTLRPSLSRIIGFVTDPNPGLAQANVVSRIPEIQTREIESVLRLQDGQVALLGGFLQSETRNNSAGIPGFNDHAATRWLGGSHSDEGLLSELVVLIRTRVTPASEGL